MVKISLILVWSLILSLPVVGQSWNFINDGCPSCCDDAVVPPVACTNTTIGTRIASYGVPAPYPTVICVTNTDKISTMSLTLSNYSHNFPNDVSVVLAFGESFYSLMFDSCGGSFNLGWLQLTLDDNATYALPVNFPFISGTYRCNRDPATSYSTLIYNSVIVEHSTAPLGFTNFISANIIPTGAWTVWVMDHAAGDGGTNYGWNLTINGSPNYAGGDTLP